MSVRVWGSGGNLSRVFINYRHEDTGMGVGRLADALREHFADDQIFHDISSIDPGADFVDALQLALADCAAVLVVIGPKWLSIGDQQGRRRLDDPDDWVRQEIVAALCRPSLRIFPLLVDGAEMPAGAELPEAIRLLARRQAHELTLRHWAKDITILVETLKRIPSLSTDVPLAEGATALAGQVDVCQPPEASPGPLSKETLAEVSAPPVERQYLRQQPEEYLSQPEKGDTQNGCSNTSSIMKGFALAGMVLAAGFVLWFFSIRKLEPPAAVPLAVQAPQEAVVSDATPGASSAATISPAVFTAEMVWLPSGCVEMGSLPTEPGRDDEERQHRVCVEAFAIGKTEVTQAQWQAVMGDNPSKFRCADCPVEQVSWTDAMAFVAKLNVHSGKYFRLPTEAEWEYACRGGRSGERYCGGDDPDSVAWTAGNSGGRSHPVGRKGSNDFGLHDMSGNVFEWTCSSVDKDYQGGERQCVKDAYHYVLRGGGWSIDTRSARSAKRNWVAPGERYSNLGFRLAMTPP